MAITLKQNKRQGRPPGSKTRADSPRMLRKAARALRLEREVTAKMARRNAPPVPANPPTASPAAVVTTPIVPPVSVTSIEARSDVELFGSVKLPPENRPRIKTELPETDLNDETNAKTNPDGNAAGASGSPQNESGLLPEEEAKAAGSTAEEHRGFATIIWDSIVGLFAMIIGAFWFPRKVGKNAQAGEIPYDEREVVISAWCKYFESIGLKALTPLQELFYVIGMYCLPRLRATFEVIRFKFMKKAKPAPAQPATDTRMPPPPDTAPAPAKTPENPVANVNLDAEAESVIQQQRET